MKKITYHIVSLFLLLVLSAHLSFSQKIEKVNGTAQVKMESNMTENDTRKLAEELAKIDALQNTFGTVTNQEFNMMIRDGEADYNVIAKTEVKGEWIETTQKHFPENFKTEKDEHGTRKVKWITCNIKGKARKVIPRAHLDFFPLNCQDKLCKTTMFADGSNLYLHFTSPVNGYLSVFIDDGSSSFRMLPDTYSTSGSENGIKVKEDKVYLFFSPNNNDLHQRKVEEYQMFTNRETEYNYLYIIFSEKPIVKPILKGIEVKQNRTLPKSLNSEDFQEWITENKYTEPSFQVKQIAITITGN